MSILLSDEELDALEGLTDFQFRLYVQGIRRHMDYKTGIVGIKRKISLYSLASETYIEKIKGVKQTGNKSRFQVHRAIKRLEKAELLIVKSIATEKEKQLILECVLATSDRSIQNKAATRPQHSTATKDATLETDVNPLVIRVLEDKENEGRNSSRTPRNEKAATYPLSGKDTTVLQHARVDFNEEGNGKNIFKPFMDLLNEQGYRPEHLLTPKTQLMLKEWLEVGVTLEHARMGIEHANAACGKDKPNMPVYYKQFVLNAKTEFEKPKSEVTNARPNIHTKRRDVRQEASAWLRERKEKRLASEAQSAG